MIADIYFKLLVVGLVFLIFLVRIPYTKKQVSNKKQIMKGAMIFIPLVLYLLALFDFANLKLPFYLRVVGLVIYFLGLILIGATHHYLGKNWHTILDSENYKTKEFVKKGPYKFIRHPMYLSAFMIIIGLGIFTLNWLFLIIPFVVYLMIYLKQIKKEEKALVDGFGERYEEYIKETGRIFPKIRRKGVN
jgi:protein-S-isoprenylcysteine O-methyltransferase Ste14